MSIIVRCSTFQSKQSIVGLCRRYWLSVAKYHLMVARLIPVIDAVLSKHLPRDICRSFSFSCLQKVYTFSTTALVSSVWLQACQCNCVMKAALWPFLNRNAHAGFNRLNERARKNKRTRAKKKKQVSSAALYTLSFADYISLKK